MACSGMITMSMRELARLKVIEALIEGRLRCFQAAERLQLSERQAMPAMHRIRQQLVRIRVMQVNQLRGLLYEFGIVLPQGRRASIEAA